LILQDSDEKAHRFSRGMNRTLNVLCLGWELNSLAQNVKTVTVRQSPQFKLFGCKRFKHLDRTIDVASQIWNHSVALKNRYYKLYGKRVAQAQVAIASGQAAPDTVRPLESG
jgi:hypothetical protein